MAGSWVIMHLNQFDKSEMARLNQILHTLQSIHGIKLNFDLASPQVTKELIETKQTYETIRQKIIQESGFNSYQQNPEYTKSMLILEAVRIMITEIAPKRRRYKKVKESVDTISASLPLEPSYKKGNMEVKVSKNGRENIYTVQVFKNGKHDKTLDGVAQTEEEALEVVNDRLHRKMDEDLMVKKSKNSDIQVIPGMHNVHEITNVNEGQPMTFNRKRILENALHQPQEYEYQASMARSELYRNAKYAMSMIKQIDPYGEVPPWIAGALTKAANYLDKVFHYLDYYKKFEPEKLPENVDGDLELGETSGGVTRENLMLILEYSIKLFNMVQPGEKLEGWVAMKLTTASECISSCKHYLDYVQFEQHGLDSHFDDGRRATARKMDEAKLMEAETVEDLQRAQTIITIKDMGSDIQKIAEKSAELGVEKLMPLVDSMRSQFGVDVANGFNEVVKQALDELLSAATKTKETIDQARTTVQNGGVPGVSSDIENAEVTGAPEPAGAPEAGKEKAAPAPAAPEEPLGRAKKEVSEARFKFNKKTGQMGLDSEDPDQRHGLYRAGKLVKATNTKDEAENLKSRDPKFKDCEIKKIAETVKEAKQAKEPGAVATAKVKKMGKSYWTGNKLTKKGIKKRDEIIKAIEKDLKESAINEKAPPGEKAESFIKKNKAKFQKRYGKDWKARLYSTAWSKFGESSQSFLQAKALVENKKKMLENLEAQLDLHKNQFAQQVANGSVKDPLGIGYGLEGESIVQKINNVQNELTEAKSVVLYEMKQGIQKLVEQIKGSQTADALLNIKAKTPYGVIYSRNGKTNKKMFESADTRGYWLKLNEGEIKTLKLVEPETFDEAINWVRKGN